MMWPFGLHGHGMHDHILRELEIGNRAALCEDEESVGFGPLLSAQYEEYCENERRRKWRSRAHRAKLGLVKLLREMGW